MTGNMAWKAGKGAFQKFSGKTDKDPTPRSVDIARYQGAKVAKRKEDGHVVFFLEGNIEKHRKDSAYYEYLGIPEKDAKKLSRIVASARFLDSGIRGPGGLKIGVNTLVELIPGVGDFAGTGLSVVLVALPAFFVSKDPNSSDRWRLRFIIVRNLAGCFGIGLLPFLGDYINTRIKPDVRNAIALEDMLLKRVKNNAKPERDAEKHGRTPGHQHADTNGYRSADPNPYYDSEPPSRQNFVTADMLRQDSKPRATARAPVVQTQPKKSGGGFFRRRGGPQGGQEVGTRMEEATPVRPPRPEHPMYERDGHF